MFVGTKTKKPLGPTQWTQFPVGRFLAYLHFVSSQKKQK